ncbi:SSI family serine proteinase inhibitor [Amycolatopsis sp. NPDC059027]|uniref:SSI family serine proteinase inhibitor n=1 Tax=unclassified Amycolatopsis TaxID=2618356 RepID=UPI00366B1C90
MAFFPLAPLAACLIGLCPAPHELPSSLELSTHEVTGRLAAVTLTCDPAGGTHPAHDSACAVLGRAKGDFDKITPRHQACTLNYSPVDVSATGEWRGKPVAFRATYGNACAADAETDGVFKF